MVANKQILMLQFGKSMFQRFSCIGWLLLSIRARFIYWLFCCMEVCFTTKQSPPNFHMQPISEASQKHWINWFAIDTSVKNVAFYFFLLTVMVYLNPDISQTSNLDLEDFVLTFVTVEKEVKCTHMSAEREDLWHVFMQWL